jgi:Helicase conserved C-terminal domain
MTKLLKLSSHLGLLQANKTPEATTKGSPAYVKYMKEREFAKVALAGVVTKLPGGDYDRNGSMMDDHFSLSGKLEVMSTLLKKYRSEDCRVLLFAHSTQTLDLIQNFVQSLGTMTFLRMDGQTDQKRRQTLADQFNNDREIFLFLLSTKATGQGLTLTGANRVILFEQSWNPSWEEQAQDRAHRIGQSRDVDVVRLVAQGTVEEMIYLRQIYKMHLKQDTLTEAVDANAAAPRVFRGVQGDTHRKGELFGFENLFRFKDGSFLEDIWAEAGESGAKDSSGLQMHRSENLASVLIGIGGNFDFERSLEEKDNVSLIQEMSQNAKTSTLTAREGKDLGIEDSDSEDSMNEPEEPLQKKIRAVNHGDLFRSDKGGAAIQEGEEGFDEEMGAATQDAYAVYEERKEDSDDDDNDDAASVGSHLSEASVNETLVQGVISDPAIDSELAASPTKCSRAERLPSSYSSNEFEGTAGLENCAFESEKIHTRAETPAPAFSASDSDLQTRKTEPSTPRKEKTPSIKLDSTAVTQSKTKIQLAGVLDVENAKTEFSISDLQLPTYGKKKKKKKKKNPD